MHFHGTSGDDNFSGTSGNDVFTMTQGGDDTVSGGDGNDVFKFGATFGAGDSVDGGSGRDTLQLDGDYSTQLIVSSAMLKNVEQISLAAGNFYNLGIGDGVIAGGQSLTVSATQLGVDDIVYVNGTFMTNASAGTTLIVDSASSLTYFDAGPGTNILHGGIGNDFVYFFNGRTFDSSDRLDAGSGTNNNLYLAGDYSSGLTITAAMMKNFQFVHLAGGDSYKLALSDANVAAGQSLTIDGAGLGAGDTLNFNGGHETNGSYVIDGGAGADIIIGGGAGNTISGGLGQDKIIAGAGADVLVYASAAESTGVARDIVTGFDALQDKFQVPASVGGIDATIATGLLRQAHFDVDLAAAAGAAHLAAGHAVLFTPDSGNLAGDTFLIVDANGTAGYQAGADLVIQLESATHLDSLTTGDFIT